MDPSSNRSRLLASSDPDNLRSLSSILSLDDKPNHHQLLTNYFSDTQFLNQDWHVEANYTDDFTEDKSRPAGVTWRLKERMKTSGVALVVCLNIGIDPPDIVKPNPCATKECWFDPTGSKQKGLEYIGNALQQQYEKWQAKAKYKQCLDPTSEELRKVCVSLRKSSRGDRLLFHYNGHGVPKPTKNGELWVFGKYYTHYTPVAICELRGWLGNPAIYVLDCSAAGVLISHLVDTPNSKNAGSTTSLGSTQSDKRSTISPSPSHTDSLGAMSGSFTIDGQTIVLAACSASEVLPLDPRYPADLFTSCLTTPITTAIRWFIFQNPYSMVDVNPDLAGNVPGKDTDRKTPRGELNWIFTAITDTIAWTTLPAKTFQKMFRQDLLVASLFRNFLLAKRIMKSFNCTAQSWPLLPNSNTHHLWQAWDMTLESFISNNVAVQKGSIMVDPKNNLSVGAASNLSFFTDQLTAFDIWLEFGTAESEPPEQLPVVLQALLSQTHRLRALFLLRKYLSLGPSAVNLSLMVGIYPYILKLLQSPADDIKQTLVSIWACIMGFDPTCRQELIREKAQAYFIQFLQAKGLPANNRCMAAFVLAEMCNQHKEGQQTCLHMGLHRVCTTTLSQPEVQESSSLKKWICLCLYKLCEEFSWAKYLCITEAGHTQLYPLLTDPDPTVRTAAVLALGEVFGASTLSSSLAAGAGSASAPGTPSRSGMLSPAMDSRGRQMSFNGTVEERDLREAELNLMWQMLDCCMDGSITVRLETIYALTKCLMRPAHIDCIKLVAKSVRKRNLEKKADRGGKRTVSPAIGPEGGAKINLAHPWHLTQSETGEIILLVEQFIESQAQQQEAPPPSLSASNSFFDRFSPTASGFGIADLDSASSRPPLPTSHSQTGISLSTTAIAAAAASDSATGATMRSPAPVVMSPKPHVPADTAWLSATENSPPLPPTSSSDAPPPPPPIRPISSSPRSEIPLGRKSLDRTGSVGSIGEGGGVATPSPYSLMASVYVRVWLALTEVQGKDPSDIVVNAAAMVRFKIYSLISGEDNISPVPSRLDLTIDTPDVAIPTSKPSKGAAPPFLSWSNSPFGSPSRKQMGSSGSFFPEEGGRESQSGSLTTAGSSKRSNKGTASAGSPPPVFPMGVAASGDQQSQNQNQNRGPSPMNTSSSKGLSSKVAYRGSQPIGDPDTAPITQSYSFGPDNVPTSLSRSGSFGAQLRKGGSMGSIGEPAHDAADDGLLNIASRTYDNAKNQFLKPGLGYNPEDDPLSEEGANRAYRKWRIQAITAHQRHIENLFKDVIAEEKNEMYAPDPPVPTSGSKKNKNGGDDSQQSNRPSAVGNLPQSVTKFEEKILLTINNAVMTSLVMFHAFQDIIAISDESSVSIWSLGNSSRIMDIRNKHTVERSPEKDMVKRINTVESSLFTPLAEPRITAMNWINESYDALLLLGSDDGVVKVWRDTSCSDSIAEQLAGQGSGTRGSINASSSTTGRESSNGKQLLPSTVELATAFAALPDIAETSRGSGMLLSWQQATGTLFAGGNSSTIRVWDLDREQCVRVFDTGTKLCLTALATTVGAFAPSPMNSPNAHRNGAELAAIENVDIPLAWSFAGFADGSIGVYDERVASSGGRVHYARDHTSWIVSAHMRADAQEVITSSVRGIVKFWDIRSWRTYKTLEVQKSPLTSMTVHNCAPVIATGSHAQFIKILTFGGEQLGNIIKYHDGFLGQRMGPITSLTFHPHRMMLAASAADCIVSIYATADDTHSHSA